MIDFSIRVRLSVCRKTCVFVGDARIRVRTAVAEIKRNSTCIALRRILSDRILLVLSNYALASCSRGGASITNSRGDITARDFFRNDRLFSPETHFFFNATFHTLAVHFVASSTADDNSASLN